MPELGPRFSSHKFAKKSGMRYEVALCILTGDIVWINGPFPCGYNPDITIFRMSLLSHLEEHERVEADDGYSTLEKLLLRSSAQRASPIHLKLFACRLACAVDKRQSMLASRTGGSFAIDVDMK